MYMEQQLQLYIKAAAHFYGVLQLQDVINILKHYEQINMTRKEVRIHVEQAIQEEKHIVMIGSYICHTRIFPDVQHALALYKKNISKPYCYPAQAIFLKYVDESYLEVTPAYRHLARFLKEKLQASEQAITSVIREAAGKISGDCDMQQIMEVFFPLGMLRNEDLGEFGALLMPVMNETRRYSNHGFTPDELAEILRR